MNFVSAWFEILSALQKDLGTHTIHLNRAVDFPRKTNNFFVPKIALQLLLLTWFCSYKMVSENWFCSHVIEKMPYVVLPS